MFWRNDDPIPFHVVVMQRHWLDEATLHGHMMTMADNDDDELFHAIEQDACYDNAYAIASEWNV